MTVRDLLMKRDEILNWGIGHEQIRISADSNYNEGTVTLSGILHGMLGKVTYIENEDGYKRSLNEDRILFNVEMHISFSR